MIYIDESGLKYKAVKKDGKYYLLMNYTKADNTPGQKIEVKKIEVKGKQNVLTYIKNNKLKKYDDTKEKEKKKEEEIRRELREVSWWI